MTHWTTNDIPWGKFDASRVQPALVSLIKTACLVEHNGEDYARYLCEVFAGDEEIQIAARQWAKEEVQHGEVLKAWVRLAEPEFDFENAFADFTQGHQLPQNVSESVRGSRVGELIARCVVETGTSTYYTAIKEATDEPVLRAICGKIAADEYRHYALFYQYLKRYQERDRVGLLGRLRIALERVVESEDDELAYAFYAAHRKPGSALAYDRADYANRYLACLKPLYRRNHIERMSGMIVKAVGLKPHGLLHRAALTLAWGGWRLRTRALLPVSYAVVPQRDLGLYAA